MAKVSLRIYNREIGTLIDQGQTDEAVGHCHHILKTFPKNLETYRLLGKAYLEAKRYDDATDIFSRVLMSVPDDFVAHVGMSLISDEKEKLDDAIWHMERAFEAQPSNAAVQGELQRLYGRRDGVEPPKVRMTSGALANVYVQGELYPQAIAEIMSVEAKDPGRADMQVLLAKAYFRSEQRVEASQIASTLLAKYPYCLDANRILIEILPETSRSEDAEVYRHRVNALDPYAAFTKDSIFNTDEVPDAAVNLERLDWKPGDTPQLTSGWGDSTGIKLDPEGKEEQPEWLKEDESARGFEPASASEASTEDEDIPDFMRAAGWGDSSGTAEELTSFFDSPEPEPETSSEAIEQGEMPDWMKSMAPSDELLTVDEISNDKEDKMGDNMASDDWITDLLGDSEDENEEKKPAESPKSEAGIEDATIGTLGTSSDDQDAAMNWLESLAANQGAKAEELITDPNARTEGAPEWVQKAQEVSADAPKPDEQPAAEKAEDIPAWLRDEEELTSPVEKDEDLSWLNELTSDAEEETVAPEVVEKIPAPADETLISDPAIGELGASADDQDAAMNWLESLAANQGAKAEELITDPNARTEDAPDWVEKAKGVIDQEPPTPEPAPVEEEPESKEAEIPMPDLAAFATDEVEALEPPAEFGQEPEKVEDDSLGWLKEMEAGTGEVVPSVSEPAIKKEDDLPAWLADIESGASEEKLDTKPDEALPDWLKSEEESTPQLQPTQASEWQPAETVSETPPPVAESKPVAEAAPEPVPVEEKTFAAVSDKLAKESAVPRKGTVPQHDIAPKEVAAPKKPEEKKRKRSKRMDTTMLRDVSLMGAKAAMDEGNIPAALEEYGKLIKKKRLLDETIYDLRDALDEYPVDISIWQMLGDAYMRSGRLQEAIDAYINAEKLLR